MPFQIAIQERLKPFSHTTWFRTVLPRTTCLVEVFPTAVHVQEWQGSTYKALFDITGPVKGFTVELDVKKSALRVFGHAQEGPFAYLLFAEEGKLYLFLEKGPLPFPLKMKKHLMDLEAFQETVPLERLSLGMHRKQEWDQVIRRCDLREILPTWLALGAQMPELEEQGSEKGGNFALLTTCKETIAAGEKLGVCPAFENLFAATFSGLFAPHVNDPRLLGLSQPTSEVLSPLPLLKEGAQLIRSLFFQEEKGRIKLLPVLPPPFHAGRFLNVQTKKGDLIDFEWTKKLLRRVRIRPGKTGKVTLQLQRPLKTFRRRLGRDDRGVRCSVNDPLELIEGQSLYLDRFEK